MQGGSVCATVPGTGDGAVFVPGAGDDVAVVLFAFRCGTRGGRVGDDVHAHCFADAGGCGWISR